MGASARDYDELGIDSLWEMEDPRAFQERRFRNLPAAAHGTLNCPEILDWAFSSGQVNHRIPERVMQLGNGPFNWLKIYGICNRRGLSCTRFNRKSAANLPTDLIVGRDGWNKEDLDQIIELHQLQHLRIYSQEMFILMLMIGRNPFQQPYPSLDVFAAFRASHPRLGVRFARLARLGAFLCSAGLERPYGDESRK